METLLVKQAPEQHENDLPWDIFHCCYSFQHAELQQNPRLATYLAANLLPANCMAIIVI